MKKFIGKYPQIVTELGSCFEPGSNYNLSEKEIEILDKRNFLSMFVEVEVEKVSTKKGK